MGARADGAARSRREEFMDTRRLQLRLTWNQVAELAGLHRDTLREFRAGRGEPNQLTKRGVEHALKWAQGSIDAIDSDGNPTPLEDVDASTVAVGPTGHGWSAEGVPLDEDGQQMTLRRIIAVLQLVESSTDDPLAVYRALWDAAQKWGIPPTVGNQSRQAG
jgi:hypothetical protein